MIPRATYRLQFHKGFGFTRAAAIAPYLARLGISHVYASPWLKARPGSTHGYDIVDHHSLNPELGTEHDFRNMVAAFNAHGLRQILDFVPNHMGVGGEDNQLWLDVLEWGPDSAHAGWFDLDWGSDRLYLHDKLLVPFLGDQYGIELYSGKLTLRFDAQQGSFAVWAYDVHKLPVCPLHYARILGKVHPELERLGDAFSNLPEWRPQVVRRAGELKLELARLARETPEVRDAIAAALAGLNGKPGDEESWRALDALIRLQFWRAANFRVAADDINYRRFFNVNELAGLRMELPQVFEEAHELVFRLFADGTLDGLRIDHVDGLLNPKEYFERLRTHVGPVYLIVEKILAWHENLRDEWPIDGTTGYEFMNLVLGILVDPAGEDGFTRTWTDFAGQRQRFADIVRDSKLRIMRNEMASELNVLAGEAARTARQNPRTADFTQNVLRRAIREIVACFPVYRTYVDAEGSPTDDDRRDLNWALSQSRANEKDLDPSVFDFLAGVFSGDLVAKVGSGFSRHAVLRFAMRLQQYSGPVMAKGLEDTAFYRYNRFVALNEVGGYPDRFGCTLSHFHKANTRRAQRWPNSMLSTSTHDTKRGEDTRARLAALSEMPDEWTRQVQTWSRILRARLGDVEGTAPPDRADEYLLYQLLLGTWPAELTGCDGMPDPAALAAYTERLKGAMTKSVREAKVHSTWSAPDAVYEAAVLAFVDAALNPETSNAFLTAFLPLQERIALLGVQNSLIQTTLKFTCPGVPDTYQGAELWDLSLVDPDNRRPVDYDERLRLQRDLLAGERTPMDLLADWKTGAIKLFFISRLLEFRAQQPDIFTRGDYEPLSAIGPDADRVCAFTRRTEDHTIVVVAARFPSRSRETSEWLDTALSLNLQLYNILTGTELPCSGKLVQVESILEGLPVAILSTSPLQPSIEGQRWLQDAE